VRISWTAAAVIGAPDTPSAGGLGLAICVEFEWSPRQPVFEHRRSQAVPLARQPGGDDGCVDPDAVMARQPEGRSPVVAKSTSTDAVNHGRDRSGLQLLVKCLQRQATNWIATAVASSQLETHVLACPRRG
jgi:hypothetical protein